MTKNKLWKRVTAGALALTIVAGAAPAGVAWNNLLGTGPIVASADDFGGEPTGVVPTAPDFDFPSYFGQGDTIAPEIPDVPGYQAVFKYSTTADPNFTYEAPTDPGYYILTASYRSVDSNVESSGTTKPFTILTKVDAIAGNCKTGEPGTVEHYADISEAGTKYFIKDDDGVFTKVEESDLAVPAVHNFTTVNYEWSKINNGYECTATATCTVCDEEITETGKVDSEITKYPTPDEKGIRTYTATFETEGFGTTKKVTLGTITPKFVERKDPTLDDKGVEEHYEYTYDDGVTKYFKIEVDDTEGEVFVEVTADDLAIPTLIVNEFDYVAPTHYVEGNIAYGVDKDGVIYVKDEDGKYVELTDVNEDGVVDVKDTVLAPTEHTYNNPSYSWKNVPTEWSETVITPTCTASRKCTVDKAVDKETGTVEFEVVTPPTTTSTGVGHWKATFKNEAFETQYYSKNKVPVDITIPIVKPESKDTVVATVNASGMAAHYEGVIDGETHYYLLNDDGVTFEEVKEESLVLERLVPEQHKAVDPTCEKDGNFEYYTYVNDDESISFFTYDEESDFYSPFEDKNNDGDVDETDTVIKAKGHIAPETPVVENYKKATCAEEGHYDLVEYCTVCKKELSRVTVTVPKTDHTPGKPVIENVVPATYTSEGSYDSVVYCTECGEEISRETITTPKLSALTYVAAKDATCETNGNIEYWYDAKEDKYFSDADGKNEITEADVTIKALGHTYGSPVWRWKSSTEVTATFGCSKCEHHEVVEATVTSVTVEPTYSTTGKTTYTAKVVFNGKTYTSSRTVTIEKVGVTHVEAVEPTCTEPGNIEYWYDAANDKYFSDANATKAINKEDTVLEATGHTYGAPTWVWNSTKSATAEFACTNGDDTQSVEATITSSAVEPTYTKTGKLIYTATAKFGGKTYSATKEVTLSKLTYTAPTITAKKGENAVKLSWNAVDFAEKYAVVVDVDGAWKLVGKTTETEFTVEDLTAGTEYKVAVIPMFDGEWFKNYSNAITVTPKGTETHVYPVVTSIDYNETYHQFRVNWDAMDGAQQYGIAVFVANKWKVVNQDISAKTLSWTSPKLKAGQKYKMVLCAKVNGSWDTSNIEARAFSVTVK